MSEPPAGQPQITANRLTARLHVTPEDLEGAAEKAELVARAAAAASTELARQYDAQVRAMLGGPTGEDVERLVAAGWRLCDHGTDVVTDGQDFRLDANTYVIRVRTKGHPLAPGEQCGGPS